MAYRFLTSLLFVQLVTGSVVVDLGYTLHQATLQNTITGVTYLNFSNVRYAAPSTGPLRFSAPSQPLVNRTVQDGQVEAICPQSDPSWINTAIEVVSGQPVTSYQNFTAADIPPVDPRTSEDCLLLNVLVPTLVYERAGNSSGSAVLVWFHGGGFVQGYKDEDGDGQDFITQSHGNSDGGIIYIAVNYRLGLFGWLGTPAGVDNAVANAGLLDQRFALEWIQKYIHLFGGDPSRVTLMGESAGGGAIMNHITAFGGKGAAPFSQAITQSAFLQPIPPTLQNRTYQQILKTANISTFAELKNMPTSDLQTVNALVVGNGEPYGTFVFGPVVDGSYVLDLPSVLLANGQFYHSLNVMAGHNSDEGLLFTSPFVKTESSYEQLLQQLFPNIESQALEHITEVLYPSDFGGQFGYTDLMGRTDLTIGDFSVVCNSHYLNAAFGNESYAYEFSVPPGIHSSDEPYTFYDGGDGQGINTTLAVLMQRYFINFAVTGTPDMKGLPLFPSYRGEVEENLNNTQLGPIHDDTASSRCAWWQEALYR